MNRDELQRRADDWVAGAKALADPAVGQWSLAYYLVGYAVEFALKACILFRLPETGLLYVDTSEPIDLGGKKRALKLETFRTHDYEVLIDLARLRDRLEMRKAVGDGFLQHWKDVSKWTSEARYEQKDQPAAETLIVAVTATDGVLPWLKTYW